jgi:hypothetical protein
MSINRVNITIPGSSSTAGAQRDEAVTKLIAAGMTQNDCYRYTDTRSGLGR